MSDHRAAYQVFAEQLTARGVDVEAVKARLKKQHIETPSWGYGDGGTRFKVFAWPGAAHTVHEKLADAAYVHHMSGIAPSVAQHIPWDKTDDWNALKQYAAELGVTIGAINPNVFQDDIYKLGSLCNASPAVREQAVEHMVECCDIMKATGSTILSVWLADGTNYAGQDSIRERKHRLYESLTEVYKHLPPKTRMLIEYKFFEPAFYHTDLADWGMAYSMALKYRYTLDLLMAAGRQAVDVVHIIGGGSQNELLCQMTANATNRPVIAGPEEATALGNALVQWVALGEIGSVDQARALVRDSVELKPYQPQDVAAWEEVLGRFKAVLAA